MTDKTNVQLVQELYAAFGRGDVPAILGACVNTHGRLITRPEETP